jgi:tetraacyldisaccharide 4'-kinase
VWAWPLVPPYAAGLAVKDGLRAAGVLKTKKLKWPVVSVGSLSAGGAGKTPVVIALAELLRAHGWNVDVLSRGYGREGSGVERVSSFGEGAAKRFGDEPVVLAQRLRLPVWVGEERFAAGTAAESASQVAGRSLHLLDDGFQHRQLARTLDVVVVTAEDLDDALLPAGNRREPLGALQRADVVVLREEEQGRIEARVRGLVRDGAALWIVRRRLMLPVPAEQLGSGLAPVAFCAIARPEGFWAMIKDAGCNPAKRFAYPDHHAYSAADVDRLLAAATECGATGFVTTAKDHVKLSRAMIDRLREVGPVDVLKLEVKFVDEAAVVHELEARIG